ncbi:hypothetical protein [Parasphingorhabdus flavimaris]|uniref:hypothetical protein n=1 Tax=Parasphingorhabdus flavimaris TaxID=266812 RepID=UPI00300279DE
MNRRELLVGAFFGSAFSMIPLEMSLAASANSAEAQLHKFLLRIANKTATSKTSISNKLLEKTTPFDNSTLLVEIAAIGAVVRNNPVRYSIKNDLLKRSKSAIEGALAEFPRSPWSHALDGAWHYEFLRRSKIASRIGGASYKKGDASFAKAVKLAGDDPGVFLALSISLISADAEDNAKRVLALLKRAPKSSGNAYKKLVVGHIRKLHALVATGKFKEAKRSALSIF